MDARQFIQDRIRSAGSYLLPSVRPLVVPDDKGDPEPAGSAVLMWHRGHRYLVSAAHVLDEFADREFSIGTATSWVPIAPPFHLTSVPAGKTRDDDHIDFGFCEIDDETAAKCDGCQFLTAGQVADRHVARLERPSRSKYLAIGYPVNRFQYKWGRDVIVPGNLGFAGGAAGRASYEREGFQISSHILVELDPNAVVGPGGVQSSPKMVGLSGGGVFHFPAIERAGLVESPTLVAITIEQRKQAKLLAATRVDLVLAGIEAVS